MMPDEESCVLNLGRKTLPGPEYLHDLIRWSSTSATAIDFWTTSGDIRHISYETLDDLTSALAKQISTALEVAGCRHGDVVVPVLLPQSPELYISWIAILKAGAAFCPIAIDSPTERVSLIVRDVSASLIVTDAQHHAWLAKVAPKVEIVDVSLPTSYSTVRCVPWRRKDNDRRTVQRPDSVAYVMYTSGSTGVPKGVKISHKAVCQALLAHEEHLPSFKRFLQFASPTFDVSVFETFFPLLRGATLVSRDREHMLADLPGTIRSMHVDAAELTPTVVATLLKKREAAPCLQLLLTIGEMLSRPVIQEFGESRTQPGILFAMYGPTEASIHCTIATKVKSSSSIHNIGRPLATVTAIVIQCPSEEHPVNYTILAKGQTGELAVAGQLSSGYLNRPEETSAAFINLPGYGVFYRTGDRARVVEDGNIEMLGRISSGQIKLRGQRVELGEIETIACRVKGVVMAAASIIDGAIVLFCVQDRVQVLVDDIRIICKRHLLRYMVPGNIVLLELDNLPRLPSGKMDRKRVENDYAGDRAAETPYNAAQLDHLTAQICGRVSEELGHQLSPSTPLWAEGLTSLMAIKVASALRSDSINVSVRDLLELQTIADMVAKVRAQIPKADIQEVTASTLVENAEEWQRVRKAVEITLDGSHNPVDILPCNAVQVAMLAETMSNRLLNFNSIELEALPNITFHDICTAFQQLAQKNEILRSGFVSTDHISMPFAQVIWHSLELDKELGLLYPLNIKSAETHANRYVIQIHHALYDGWSWNIIMSDLSALLARQPIPERPQFRRVSREQRRVRHRQQEAAEDYWREQLVTATPFRLPQLNPVLDTGSERHFERRTIRTTNDALTKFARQLHISSQTILSTAVSLLLSSYSGSLNVVLGLVSSGRTLPVPEIEKVIGPCLWTLPLRVDLSAVRTIQDALLYIYGLEKGHLEHGSLSLRDILTNAGISSQQKLFEVLFIWQESLPLPQHETKPIQVIETRDCLDYALVIEAEPSEDGLVITLNYDIARVSVQHANYFLMHLDHLLAAILNNKESSLDNVWKDCDTNILAVANPKPQVLDRSFSLTSTIGKLAREKPTKPAISFVHDFNPETGAFNAENLTYGELWAQSNQIAHSLRRLGVGVDDVVVVLIDRSLDLYVLNLAILMAGGAFLNVDTRTPSGRIRQILCEVKCRLVISGQGQISSNVLENIALPSIPFSEVKTSALDYRSQQYHSPVNLEGSHLAYVVMTSGTTGVPKAILVTHANLLSNIEVLSKTYPRYNDHDLLLQACSPAFDVFVFELFWTWHMGLSLCSSTNDILFRDIEGFIRAVKISHLSLTPSVAALIHPDNVPSVRFLVTAGEPMNAKVFADWAGRGLFQGYGPAETTNICNVKGPVQKYDLISNVGPPLLNTSICICATQDRKDLEFDIQVLPVGAVGEIVIGGEQVARGYTAQNLTTRSFINTRYGRVYRSGDMGRLLANGDLIVLGREDDQVKLRGQRVELGDINSAIAKAPFVEDAVTIVIDQNGSKPQLVSFWTTRGEQELPNACLVLYELLEATIPSFMVPEIIVPIDAIPLTRQGKVDNDAVVQHFSGLSNVQLQRYSRGAAMTATQEDFMDEEKLILQILSEVTDTPLVNIKPNTSFYSLGLDSISSVRLSQKLRQANLGQADVSLIMKHCSVRRLRKALADIESLPANKSDSLKLDEVLHVDWREYIQNTAEAEGHLVEKIVPCTPLQESILVAQANTRDSSTYEARMEFKFNGDEGKLRAAWSHMVRRHQILRTAFALTPSVENAYAQVVLRDFELPWCPAIECSPLYTTKSHYFTNPPWRLVMTKACPDEHASLTLIMSHVLYDFEALKILLREVELSYKGLGLISEVPPDTYISYMLNMSLDKVDAFWHSRLEGCRPRSFTTLFQEEDSHVERHRTYTISSNVLPRMLQEAAEKSSATQSTLLRAAWARLLSCYSKDEDVVFGTVLNGRNLPIAGVENIVAPLFNTLPLRVRMSGLRTMRDLIAKIHGATLEMLPFQPSSLRRIVRRQRFGGQPLFDTLVLVQSEDLILDEDIWALQKEEGDMEFPGVILEIMPRVEKSHYTFKLHVQSEKIDFSTAQCILRHYDILLSELVQYSQAQSNDFASINSDLPLLVSTTLASSRSGAPKLASKSKILSDLELNIRGLFAQFSGTNAAMIQRTTSIFELGLDSLHVVQIASQLNDLGYNVTGADVLEAQTIARLSQACELPATQALPIRSGIGSGTFDLQAFDLEHRKVVCEQLGITQKDVQAIRPCTPTQSGILTEFINSRGRLYFNSIVLEFRATIDLTLLKRAWQTVMDRNEMLRSGFVMLNTPEHTYGIITYTPGTRDLPWLMEEDCKTAESEDLGEACLENLHEPCWRLITTMQKGLIRLEVYLLHSLYDAYSLNGLLSEVGAICQGQESDLPTTVPVDTAMRSILDQNENAHRGSEDFWRGLGRGKQPTKFPNLNVHYNIAPENVTVSRLSSILLPELEQGCRRLKVTLQTVCQVAWARLLAAYTGEPKVIFGVVLSGRKSHETAHALFPTINTVPFLLEVKTSTDEMLKEATEVNLGLYKHQFTPAMSIKEWLQFEEQVHDTILVLHKPQPAQEENKLWKLLDGRAAAQFAISLEILPRNDAIVELRIISRSDVVPAGHAAIILRQFEILLQEIVLEDHGTKLMPKSLLSIAAAKDAPISTNVRLLHDFVDATCTKTPNAPALEFAYSIADGHVDKRCWTYRQLQEESNRIAHLLLRSGVKLGDFVAVCFEKCPEASFAILAVLKAGCAYVAIDPAAPVARKRFMLEDAGCKILLTTRNLFFSDKNGGNTNMLAVDDSELLCSYSRANPVLKNEVQPSDVCYCLYTSGTTGQPKGCLITHANAVQAMLSFQRIFARHWDSNSRWLQFASFHFDVSVLEQYWSWSVGICVTSAPRDILFEDIAGAIDALQITHLDLTPSLARLLRPEQVPSLCRGVFIVGGEQVTQDIIDIWGDIGCLFNFYGPSEVTIGCTVHKRVKKGVKATNIGQPWDNVGAFVLEPGSEVPVLRGAVGELCLSGPLVGKGYLNRPELTAEKFVILQEYNVRIYRSGDLVRLLHDDSFEFLGRIDDQVKLRGQRLEIREIDHAIKQASNSIMDVATMVIQNTDLLTEKLVAFFTVLDHVKRSPKITTLTSVEAGAIVSQVQRRLRDMLPGYMVPSHLVPISHIPLSANNKADLKALKAFSTTMPTPSLENMEWNGTRIMPETSTTRKVINILAAFLRVSQQAISPASNLFELGLDSISAVAFANLLRKEGLKNVDAAKVMRRPVVADLASELNGSDGEDYEHAVEMAKQEIDRFRRAHGGHLSSHMDAESCWPCTPLQEDMLAKTVHRCNTPFYLSTFHYAFDMSITAHAVKNAWAKVQQRFPILRTTFFEVSNRKFVQVVHQRCAIPIRYRKLIAEEDAISVTNRSADEWCNETNVLGNEPCWQVEIVETPTAQLYMSLKIFHGLYDASSLSILLREVAYVLRNDTKQASERYADFHEALPFGPLCRRAGVKDFWLNRLSTPLLLDLLPRYHGSEKSSISYCVEHALPDSFLAIKNRLTVTDAAIFQAAYLLSLHRRFGAFATVGLVVSGRSFPMMGVEAICGPMFNTIPFQIQPKPDWSHTQLIKASHEFNVESKLFEHTPLRDISKWIGLDPGKALFDSLFVFQRTSTHTAGKSEDLWTEIGQTSTPDYPLNVEVDVKENSFKLTIVADPEFQDKDDLHSLASDYLSSLEQIVKRPDDLLHPEEGIALASPHIRPVGTVRKHEEVDSKVLHQVKSQIAILAFQGFTHLTDDVNLFSLGLDSISLIKLSGALKKCDLPVSVNIIMQLSTPAAIAEYLTKRKAESATTVTPKMSNQKLPETFQMELKSALRKQEVSLDGVENIFPVTALQEGVLASFEKYYHFTLLRIPVQTDFGRLQLAWKSVVMLHPVLRSKFVAIDDPEVKHAFAQLIMQPRDIEWKMTRVDSESELQQLLVQQHTDMVRAGLGYPSFNIKFFTAADSESRYILLGMSHAIYDGWSIQLLHQDVASLYQGHQVQRPPIELYLHNHLLHTSDDATIFWTNQVSSLMPNPFPTLTNKRTATTVFHRMTIESRTQSSTVQRFCMDHSVTVQALGLTIWSNVLASYLHACDICFGVVLACRDPEDADQLMFPTFNTVPFRTEIKEGSHLDLLQHIHQLSLKIAEHQHFPLKHIKKLHPRSAQSSKKLFDTLFVLQKRLSSDTALQKLYEEVDLSDSPNPEYPVNVEMDLGTTLTWTVVASGTVLDHKGVRMLIGRLEDTLEMILQQPNGTAMKMSKPEDEFTTLSAEPAQNAARDSRVSHVQEMNAPDKELRDAIFDTITSVARCSTDSLSGSTNIYSIGLDSISVIKITGLLRKKDIALPVSKILAALTLDNIVGEARRIRKSDDSGISEGLTELSSGAVLTGDMQRHLETHGIAESAVETMLPASAGQIFMLDYYRASGKRLFYPLFRYKIHHGKIFENEVLRAWDKVVAALPALRTRFVESGGKTWQVVIKPDSLKAYSPAAHLSASRELGVMVVELQLHHALYDAVSLPIIISAFERACRGHYLHFRAGQKTLRSFIEATRSDEWRQKVRRSFWLNYLVQAPWGNSAVLSSFDTIRSELVQENAISDSALLVSGAANDGISLQALFLAAVGRVYARSQSYLQESVVIGFYLANRGLDMEGLAEVAAPIVNVVPLVINIRVDLLDCAKGIQEKLAVVQRAEHCGVTLREIYEWTNITIDCFVNFVPRTEDDDIKNAGMYGDCNGEPSEEIKLVPYPHASRHTAMRQDQGLISPFLGPEPAEELPWCVPSVDVEAKLEKEGGLTMAVFAPEDKLSEEGAEVMLDEIKEALMGFQQA